MIVCGRVMVHGGVSCDVCVCEVCGRVMCMVVYHVMCVGCDGVWV